MHVYYYQSSWKLFIWSFIRSPSDSEKTLLAGILDSMLPATPFLKTSLSSSCTVPIWLPCKHHSCCPCCVADGCTTAQCRGTPAGVHSWSAQMSPGLGCIKGTWLSGKRMLSLMEACLLVHANERTSCKRVESDVMGHLLTLFDTVLCILKCTLPKRASLDMVSIGVVSWDRLLVVCNRIFDGLYGIPTQTCLFTGVVVQGHFLLLVLLPLWACLFIALN